MAESVQRLDPTNHVSFWINHASRLILRRFEDRLRPLGYGWAYLPVLVALRECGPLTQKELAADAHVEQPSMAQLLGRMERDGVVTRAIHPTDRRKVLYALSDRAASEVPVVLQALEGVADEVTAGFSDDDRERLMTLLRRVVRNLDPGLEEPG